MKKALDSVQCLVCTLHVSLCKIQWRQPPYLERPSIVDTTIQIINNVRVNRIEQTFVL